jgi:hypothetical protein
VEIDDIRVLEVCHPQVPTETWASQVGYKRIAIENGTLHASSELLLGKDGMQIFLHPIPSCRSVSDTQ